MIPRRKSFAISIILCIGFVMTVMVVVSLSGTRAGRAEVNRAHGSDNLLRLHVIAHSDRPADQQMKLKVRDALLNELSRIGPVTSREQLEYTLRSSESSLTDEAERVLSEAGSNLPVDIEIGPFHFPEKQLGSTVFPSGTYHAVRVIIGEGQGENWWCVLFPPLCFVEKDGITVPVQVGNEEKDESTALSERLSPVEDTERDDRSKIRFELRLWNTIAQSSYADRMRAWFQIASKDE